MTITTNMTSTASMDFGFTAFAATPQSLTATHSSTSSPASTPASKYADTTQQEIAQAGNVSEELVARLGLKRDGKLADRAPTIADGYLSASKIVKKSPPPPASGRLKYRNPLLDMEPGDAIECPAENAGIKYSAAEARVYGTLTDLKKRRGWEVTTRREGGSLWVYRIA